MNFKFSFLFLILLNSLSSFAFEESKSQLTIPYEVLSDTLNKKISEGKCEITGQVTFLGEPVGRSNIMSDDLSLGQTRRDGKFRILIDTSIKYLSFFTEGYNNVHLEFYEFKNQHSMNVKMFIPENIEMIICDKPVIYGYTEGSQTAEISIHPKGNFTFIYPEFSNPQKNEWFTNISSAGFSVNGKNHPYLFYETSMNHLEFNPSQDGTIEGFSIKKEEVIPFLEQQLLALNFDALASTDFITYWAPRMMKYDQVLVQFLEDEEYDVISEIQVSPQPDEIKRVYLLFSEISENIVKDLNIKSQVLSPMEYSGFSILEWGGSEIPNKRSKL